MTLSTVEKFLTGVIALALVATLVANGKNTSQAVTGVGSALSGLVSSAKGTTSSKG